MWRHDPSFKKMIREIQNMDSKTAEKKNFKILNSRELHERPAVGRCFSFRKS